MRGIALEFQHVFVFLMGVGGKHPGVDDVDAFVVYWNELYRT